jgi:hypothetical protein
MIRFTGGVMLLQFTSQVKHISSTFFEENCIVRSERTACCKIWSAVERLVGLSQNKTRNELFWNCWKKYNCKILPSYKEWIASVISRYVVLYYFLKRWALDPEKPFSYIGMLELCTKKHKNCKKWTRGMEMLITIQYKTKIRMFQHRIPFFPAKLKSGILAQIENLGSIIGGRGRGCDRTENSCLLHWKGSVLAMASHYKMKH